MSEENKNPNGSTGPKTKEGKAIASMNALKHGKTMRMFHRISEHAGNLAICKNCGEPQQKECASVKKCMLQEELTYAYHIAQSEKNLDYVEQLNVLQSATMDLIFTQRLRWALTNMGEYERVFNEKGKSVKVPVVRTEHIYELINTMRALSKTMPDMQLTRQTQENIDVEWAKLLEAKISEEQALSSRNKIMELMRDWGAAKQQGEKMAQQDSKIQQFLNEGKIDNKKALPDIGTLKSPFDASDEK